MDSNPGPRRFATTRWSLVLTAGDSTSPDSGAALATLCEAYWYPVYAFVRRSGYGSDDARDLTQAFFARILEKELLKNARRERGRFRSFLLTSLRNFLANQYDWNRALKRGGGYAHLSIEFDVEEQRYQREPAADLTPERVYERRWATSVLEQAMRRLEAIHRTSTRRDLFERLRQFLTDDTITPSKDVASELGMSAGALRVAVHRLRRQYASILRETIADTVDSADEVDDELRYLLDVVSR